MTAAIRAAKKITRKNVVDQSKPPVKIAVVQIHGVIVREQDGSGSYVSWDTHREDIANAFAWKQGKAVVLDIDCFGGSPAETTLLANEIRRQSEFHNKPVYAFVRTAAVSGGYWLAAAAKEIYALPISTVGSIGVVNEGFGYDKKIKKLGVERRVFTAGKNKVTMDPFQPLKPEHIKAATKRLDGIHQEFIKVVKQYRGDRLNGSDKKLMNGDVWLAEKALKLGLIDGIGDMMETMPKVMKRPVLFKVFKTETPGSSGPSLLDFFKNLKDGDDPTKPGATRHNILMPQLK